MCTYVSYIHMPSFLAKMAENSVAVVPFICTSEHFCSKVQYKLKLVLHKVQYKFALYCVQRYFGQIRRIWSDCGAVYSKPTDPGHNMLHFSQDRW